MSYDKWKARLAGEKPKTWLLPDAADEGYYRKPVLEGRLPNGRPNITGWIPVAYWLEDGALVGTIGNRSMTPEDLGNEELWSYCVSNPVSYETFLDVLDGAPWPDAPVKRSSENQTAQVAPQAAETAAEQHAAPIRLIVESVKDMKIDSEEAAAIWLGTKNTLAALRLAADKAGKAIYQPPFAAYKKAFNEWHPMVKAAIEAEDRIVAEYKTFQNERRIAAERAAAEQARARQEEEERNQRAADRAIARGEEPPEPEVEETAPLPAAPAPVVPTVGTRTPKLEMQTFLDQITDEAAVCAFFRGDPDLVATLKTLIGRAIKRGQTVPGITTREGFV